MGIDRRTFGALGCVTLATLALPRYLRAQGKPRVVVIGGGAGGATAAKYIARGSKGAIDVTLVEGSDRFTSCFYSNLYLGGFRDFDSITHSYDALVSSYGIRKVTALATTVDRDKRVVTLSDGSSVPYDRLVLSPGIDIVWDSVPGYSEADSEIAPHAWKAGPQTELLKKRIGAVKDGGTIVMVAPPNPYRCPPGPYERASMMAHVLKAKGFKNARIVILDPKDKFSKQSLFQEGWEKHYPGMIEWLGPDVHGGIKSVDAKAGKVVTDFDTFEGALLNIIPAQKAGQIAQAAGVADEKGFCPIDAASMRSVENANIYVIGDAAIAGDMPKSAFSANSQAKVAANAILAELTGSKAFPARYANTCWSLIETDDSVKIGAQYEPKDGKITAAANFVSQPGEDAATRRATYEESVAWYSAITSDMFG
jgi:sulfide dehydrogenase [flavocytochrome c] flavoprotein chain